MHHLRYLLIVVLLVYGFVGYTQLKWVNVDADYAPLPPTVQVFKTSDSLDGKPFIAYYVKAKLKDKKLDFTADTTLARRFTPLQFYERNKQPLVVVNCTFFSFATNQNLNVVIKDGRLITYNIHSIAQKGKDSLLYRHPFGSAIGINNSGKADIAWLITDSAKQFAYAYQYPLYSQQKDSLANPSFQYLTMQPLLINSALNYKIFPKKWKMKTAVGGGPVLVQHGETKITNDEEMKFAGKAIYDKHPRTLMGYTPDGHLIIMAIQGRFPGLAEGASLEQEAKLMIELGCYEALNLDGGGSSCMLVNGKETIKPSDKTGERPVPAVFIIKNR